jgi:hypothetical protein
LEVSKTVPSSSLPAYCTGTESAAFALSISRSPG